MDAASLHAAWKEQIEALGLVIDDVIHDVTGLAQAPKRDPRLHRQVITAAMAALTEQQSS